MLMRLSFVLCVIDGGFRLFDLISSEVFQSRSGRFNVFVAVLWIFLTSVYAMGEKICSVPKASDGVLFLVQQAARLAFSWAFLR